MADKSFDVLVVEDDPTSSKLVQAILEEGVETEGQLALLQNLGCDIGQGYLISRPLDPERALLLIKKKGSLL